MRMFRCQFRCILDADDPFPIGDRAQCRGQQSRLTRAGSTRNQKRQPGGNNVGHQLHGLRADRSSGCQSRQILGGGPQNPQ